MPERDLPRRRPSPSKRSPSKRSPKKQRRMSPPRKNQPFQIYVDSPFRTPPNAPRTPTTPEGLLRLLKRLDARMTRGDYYDNGEWDIEGMRDDVRALRLRQ